MNVIFNVTLNSEWEAYMLAQYLKRMTFEDAYDKAGGKDEEQAKEYAYDILSAVECVREGLAKTGYNPR